MRFALNRLVRIEWPAICLGLFGGVGLTALIFRLRSFSEDDSFISLVYARNVLAGSGFSWNAGEPIEGYSNFTFVLMVAAVGALGIDLVTAGRIIGILFGAATVAATFSLFRQVTPRGSAVGPGWSVFVLVLVAVSPPLVAWSFGGLETTLFAFVVTKGLQSVLRVAASRDRAVFGVVLWFWLATLTRPDGGVFLVASLIFLAVQQRTMSSAGMVVARVLSGYLLLLAPYAVWKLWYFGSLLPNTYLAKSFGIPIDFKLRVGAHYVWSSIATPPCLILITLVLLFWRRRSLPSDPLLSLSSLVVAIVLGYQLVVGGDSMKYSRFLVPVLPILAVTTTHSLRELVSSGQSLLARSLGGAQLLLVAIPIFLIDSSPSPSPLLARVASDYIESTWPGGSLVALNAAGALPFFLPQYRYLDMLGLNDHQIARRRIDRPQGEIGHNKGDGAYVLSRSPDFVLLGFPYGEERPMFLSGREMLADPSFERRYRKVTAAIEVAPEFQAELRAAAVAFPNIHYSGTILQFTYFQRRSGAS